MAHPALNFVEPQQQRSRDALRRIYDAVNVLLDTTAFDQLTVAHIARAASVSVGSIYQRFGSKDDLLWALYEVYLLEAEERIASFTNDSDPPNANARLELTIRTICALFRAHRGTVRSLLIVYRQTPEKIPDHHLARVQAVYRRIVSFLQSGEIANAAFAFSLIMSACRDRVLFGEAYGLADGEETDNEFIRLLTMATGALTEQ